VETGIRHFGGETTVTVSGDGEVVVIRADASEERRRSRKLDPAELQRIVRTLVEHRLWALASARKFGTVGESRIHLRVVAPSHSLDHAVALWANEQRQIADLDASGEMFKALMKDVSGGAAAY
jgi:hypothetical protein